MADDPTPTPTPPPVVRIETPAEAAARREAEDYKKFGELLRQGLGLSDEIVDLSEVEDAGSGVVSALVRGAKAAKAAREAGSK